MKSNSNHASSLGLYCAKRFLHMIPTLLGITFICFFVIHLAPGDYFTQLQQNPEISLETIEKARQQFGLDKPIFLQYLRWMWGIVRFDFGQSLIYKLPIGSLILQRLGNTLLLAIIAMLGTWVTAIPLGIICALYRNKFPDTSLTVLSFIGMSLPTFFIAFLLVFLASITGWLPVGGIKSINYDQLGFLFKIVDRGKHLIIPVSVLVVASVAGFIRLMRANMIEVLNAPYILTARAKGVHGTRLIWIHALRNAINPFITIFGYQLSGLLSGVALTEAVLSWPGLGRLMLEAVLQQDIFLVMGILFTSAVLLLVGNLLADVLLRIADPRIRE